MLYAVKPQGDDDRCRSRLAGHRVHYPAARLDPEVLLTYERSDRAVRADTR
jgi:hypothetical protein